MLGEPVKADEAHRLGLLTRLADDDERVLPQAQDLAARLAAGPTIAYAQIKRELATTGGLAETLAAEGGGTGGLRCHRRPPQRDLRVRGQGEADLHRPVAGHAQHIDRERERLITLS
jgi:enoyl-CoA hydratase/carnithine racemase